MNFFVLVCGISLARSATDVGAACGAADDPVLGLMNAFVAGVEMDVLCMFNGIMCVWSHPGLLLIFLL